MANNPPPSGAQPPRPPPVVGSLGPQNFASPLPMHFRPMPQGQPGQHFIPASGQQFRPVGQAMPAGQHYSQPMQQLPPWQSQPGHAPQYAQPSRPPQSAPPYAYAPSPFQQNTPAGLPQYQQMPQMHAPVASVGAQQPWLSSGGHSIAPLPAPVQPSGQQPSMPPTDPAVHTATVSQQSASDWQEHTAADGRRYYYNKITKQSCWEKPFELMTPIERADASTVWKEFTTADGKKYYYNKDTKQSKWTIPDELRLAREQAEQAANQRSQPQMDATLNAPAAVAVTLSETSAAAVSVGSTTSSMAAGFTSSPFQIPSPTVFSGASAIPVSHSSTTTAVGVQSPVISMTPPPSVGSGSTDVPTASVDAKTTSFGGGAGNPASEATASPIDGASVQDSEEEKKGSVVEGKSNATPGDEKSRDDEPLVFATKLEAKNAFKSLLESANVQGDWTWEQTMREISNDKRFGALRTPGERKQAFNEYLGQRKKLEAEERRIRQRKAREEFTKMLEESKELTSSMKWSKAMSLFEDDERYKAVERARDREDLFESYIVELERKEKEKAAEDHRRNVAEFRKFIESCDFIKVSSQWRKVQDRLEDDERCLRLEKLDRLLIFQDYIRVLEREDEEQKKIQKEQLRRVERKNRDEFRKLMEEHVSAGTLTAKTHWLDYCSKVKDLPQYHAVATNMSGSTPKDLFEDVTEELEKQFQDDKTRIKDALKGANITVVSSWAFEDFKIAVPDEAGSPAISDINLKLVYDELVERAKEKEEKEAKKRQRLADDFTKLLHTFKEITASSNWEDCRPLLEESQEYRSIDEENFKREIFEEYVAHLMEKAKEKERKREEEKAKKEKEKEEKEKRKEKEKEKKEKEKEREREKGKERTKKDETDSENIETTDSHLHKEDKKREKDKDRKHRKRHQSANDDISSDKDEKEDSKKSRRHSSDRKKSRKHAYSPESDGESRHKKHKRDHRDGSRRNGGYDDLEDGELGEDGEIK